MRALRATASVAGALAVGIPLALAVLAAEALVLLAELVRRVR